PADAMAGGSNFLGKPLLIRAEVVRLEMVDTRHAVLLVGGPASMPYTSPDDRLRPKDHAMNDAAFRSIGKPLPRKEDERLVTGKGRFTDDFWLDGQAHAVMVRSPYPHARIVRVNKAPAQAMPGVLGVFTGADCQHLDPIPHDPVPKTKYDMKLTGPGG